MAEPTLLCFTPLALAKRIIAGLTLILLALLVLLMTTVEHTAPCRAAPDWDTFGFALFSIVLVLGIISCALHFVEETNNPEGRKTDG